MTQPGPTLDPPTPDDSPKHEGISANPEPASQPEAMAIPEPTSTDAPPGAAAAEGDFARELEAFDRTQPRKAKGSSGEVRPGARVKATVRSVGEDVSLVDFGGRSEGSVETRHFKKDDGTLKVGVGDVVDLYVVEAGDQVTLAPSLKPAGRGGGGGGGAAMRQVREALASGMPVSGRVTGVNAGGISVDIGGV